MGTITDPASVAVAVTPSDSADISATGMRSRGLYVGAAGNIACRMDNGDVTFVGCPAGLVLPIRTKRVLSTGTTATSIVAFF